MGLITASIRMNELRQSKLDLEYKIQLITQARMNLAQSTSDLTQVGADYDSNSPIAKTLAQRQAKLKILEQKLEQQMMDYQQQLKMIEAEQDSAKEMFNNNVKTAFQYEL